MTWSGGCPVSWVALRTVGFLRAQNVKGMKLVSARGLEVVGALSTPRGRGPTSVACRTGLLLCNL